MLRKRAFDILRKDYVAIGPQDSLGDAVNRLFAHLAHTPDMDAAALVGPDGFVGVADSSDMLAALGDCAVDDGLRMSLGASDFEPVFAAQCRTCLTRPAVEMLDRRDGETPVVGPRDALVLVLDAMQKAGSRFAAVVDGGRVLGLVSARDILGELARLAETARQA
jgi:CBS domain-containing protein